MVSRLLRACCPAAGVSLAAVLLVALAATGPALAHAGNYASLVMDGDSGEVLHAVNAEDPRYPASLTKMMTLYLLFEALDRGRVTPHDTMPVSAYAAAQPPSKLGLSPGDRLRVEDAVLALVTKSANDAAAVVAEHLAGSESTFAERMTARAQALGMNSTTFRNASGLPNPGQLTTARDMAILGRALLRDFPHYYTYFSTASFYYEGASHPNHNRMLHSYNGIDGIKTGFINASGFNLVASAKRDGRRLIGVVFGARTSGERARIMAGLLDSGFALPDAGTFAAVPSEQALLAQRTVGRRERDVQMAQASAVSSRPGGPRAVQVAQQRKRAVSHASRQVAQASAVRPTAASRSAATATAGKTKAVAVSGKSSGPRLAEVGSARLKEVTLQMRQPAKSTAAAKSAPKSKVVATAAPPQSAKEKASKPADGRGNAADRGRERQKAQKECARIGSQKVACRNG